MLTDVSMTAYCPLSVRVYNNYIYRFFARFVIFSLSASLYIVGMTWRLKYHSFISVHLRSVQGTTVVLLHPKLSFFTCPCLCYPLLSGRGQSYSVLPQSFLFLWAFPFSLPSVSFSMFFTCHSLHVSKLSYPLSSVTSNILLHASIVTLMVPFRTFCFRDLLVGPVKKSIYFSSCLLACCFSKVCNYIYHWGFEIAIRNSITALVHVFISCVYLRVVMILN
jgi:hypothetical protein